MIVKSIQKVNIFLWDDEKSKAIDCLYMKHKVNEKEKGKKRVQLFHEMSGL